MMRPRSLRARFLTGNFQSDRDCEEIVEGLLKGNSVDNIPPRLVHKVITIATAQRKDCIIQGRDATAAKLDVILSELKSGPNKYLPDTPANPIKTRARSMVLSRGVDFRTQQLSQTESTLIGGARARDIDSVSRQCVKPVMLKDRVLQVSRQDYHMSHKIDGAYDNVVEYSVDSRRLGPKLQRVQALQKKLDDARASYDHCREVVHFQRQQYEALESAAEEELEDRIKADLLEFGSHVPTSLPLEYSKVTNRVLNLREREVKASRIRYYDDATSFRKEATKLEKEQLQHQNELFVRAFNRNRAYKLKKQEDQRDCFREIWRRKKEKVSRDTRMQLAQARTAVENLERELADATKECNKEMERIRRDEAIAAQEFIDTTPRR